MGGVGGTILHGLLNNFSTVCELVEMHIPRFSSGLIRRCARPCCLSCSLDLRSLALAVRLSSTATKSFVSEVHEPELELDLESLRESACAFS